MSSISAINGTTLSDYTERIEPTAASAGTTPDAEPASGAAAPAGTDFSTVLADAMRDGMMRSVTAANSGLSANSGLTGMTGLTGLTGLSGMPGMPGSYLPNQDQGIEQAILNAASSGQMDDAQVALFMLMMMMQTSQEGEFSMLMQMMASMLMQIQSDQTSLRGNVMNSGFDPFILDSIDRHIFNWRTEDGWATGQVHLPLEHWRPTKHAIESSVGDRSPELYRAVIDQFAVETAERYRPFRDGNTYCNIFMWDVTRAMGAEIPHYTDPETGEARYYPDVRGARSMGAIATCAWLGKYGAEYGWREVDAETAQMHANEGKPAVTSAGSLGHVQVICPSRDGGYDPVRGVTIAQAGSTVTNYRHISGIYSANALANNVKYWIHD